MVELLRYLEAHGFTNFIVWGGGRDFIRPITQEVYGILPEHVIGSTVSLSYREDGDGGDLIHQAEADVLDDGPTKPVRIWSRIGRRPILAGATRTATFQCSSLRERRRVPRCACCCGTMTPCVSKSAVI